MIKGILDYDKDECLTKNFSKTTKTYPTIKNGRKLNLLWFESTLD